MLHLAATEGRVMWRLGPNNWTVKHLSSCGK